MAQSQIGGATPETVAAAVAASVPPFMSAGPLPEAGSPQPGVLGSVPRGDHRHPRLTTTAAGTLDAAGEAAVTFTRVFDVEPAVTVLAVENNTNTVPRFKVKSFTRDANGKVNGCTIYGDRARALPVINPLSTVALLTGVITGINVLSAALTGFLPFEAAAGSRFSLIALLPSTV